MKFSLKGALAFFALFSGLVLPVAGLAEDSTATTTDAAKTEEKVTTPAEYQKFSSSYFGSYNGPAVNHLTSGGGVDTNTLQMTDGDQYIKSSFRFDYYLNPNVFVGPVVNFQANPTSTGSAFKMLDSGVRIGHTRVLHTDDMNLSADFRIFGPMKPAYRAYNEIIDFQSLEIFTYTIPKSKVTLGFLAYPAYQIYAGGLGKQDNANWSAAEDFSLYFAPTFSYQFTKSLAAVVYYELYPYHNVGQPFGSWVNSPTDIAPGISWDITENINFTPQVLIYPAKMGWDSLGTIAYLYWKIL